MIDLFIYPKLRDEFELSDRVWFQQNGATCHTTDASLMLSGIYFNDNVIGRRLEIQWPAHSCDLNPLDFFLWGIFFFDDRVKLRKPRSLRQLKKYIVEEIQAIDKNVLHDVIQNFSKRLDACIAANGGYLALWMK